MTKRSGKIRKTLWGAVTIVLLSSLMTHQAFGLNQCDTQSAHFYAKQPFRRSMFTSALLQFFDPSNSSLSEPLTYLWYRQIYESISDLPRAGVLRMLDDQNVCPTAKTLISTAVGNHDLAAGVAQSIQAQFAIWGVLVGFNQGRLTIAASLTVPDQNRNLSERVNANHESPEWKDWLSMPLGMRDVGAPLVVPKISADRINFAPFIASLGDLYGASAAVRCARENGCPKGSIKLYDAPSAHAKGVDISIGDVVDIDLQGGRRLPTGKFVPVRIKETGERGWVYAYYLSFLPSEVYVGSNGHVLGYTTPDIRIGKGSQIPPESFLLVVRSVLRGPVRGARRWFLTLTPGGKKLWVQSSPNVSTVWPTNFVNFTAGLYRYALGKYRSAYDEFSVFTRRANEREENVATSLAYQFMAACLLAGKDGRTRGAFDQAIALLDKAVALTPFDGRVKLLRAYVRFEWTPAGSMRVSEGNYIYSDLSSASDLLSPMTATDARQMQLLSREVAKYFPKVEYANSEASRLTRCDVSLGKVSISEETRNSWISVGLPPPAALLKVYGTQSHCFSDTSEFVSAAGAEPAIGSIRGSIYITEDGLPGQGEVSKDMDRVTLTFREANTHRKFVSVGEVESTQSSGGDYAALWDSLSATPAEGYAKSSFGRTLGIAYLKAFNGLVSGISTLARTSQRGTSESLTISRPCVMHIGPNRGAAVVQTLSVGDTLYPTGILEDDWLKVETALGKSGWVAGSCVEE